MMKRFLIGLAAVLLLLVLAVGEPGKAQVEPLNIVVIMSDDQDMDSLPVMRHLMSNPRGDWVRFTGAFANDAKCCPSRSTFLSGQYSHNHGVVTNGRGLRLNDGATLAVDLDRAGYRTALIGKYLIGYPWSRSDNYRPPGWDVWDVARAAQVDTTTAKALSFLSSTSEPFFLYLPYYAPHAKANPPPRYAGEEAYVPPRRPNFNEADVSDKPLWVRRMAPLSASAVAAWDRERLNSQRELMAIDDGVLAIVERLETLGRLDNTVIVYLADQGFSWGAHRWIHKNCAYDECSNYPLFIRYPGAGNRTEPRLVSNADLAPTLLELAGATATGRVMDGRSFAALLRDAGAAWGEGVLLERHGGTTADRFYAIRAPGWMYAEYRNGDRELYDLGADPFQLVNVVNRPEYAGVRATLAGQLAALVAGDDPATPTPTATPTLSPTATETETTTPTATATEEPTGTTTP